ncbi:TetR family transcriptional regulator [Mycobacterium sp. MS1601]|uniref:TetR/AcrR family transcriptional regulator n=1 Tax=Mycobacterium sp. MS1601 TaxID=1936029 RepID=UPI00097946F2|nr:TetR/AcrR family transcriptional regulator [Mycobacterium sp. MS1601]AQA04716.1 TetR family transcriptional regulator [Mycobacterium sp. MS1601]
MASVSPVSSERRTRPKDRKEQIARASAEAFSELGYHGVSMEDIARRVGVTAASLYRHYAGKYDLFRAAVLGMGEHLLELTAYLEDAPEEAAAQNWDLAVASLTDSALKNRASGGMYRWEGRFLEPEHQQVLDGQMALVNKRLQKPMSALRPNLTCKQRTILTSAVLSVIGSITDHHARLSTERVQATMNRIARDIRDTDLPTVAATEAAPRRRVVGAAAGEYEQILHAALVLINERGYRDTGVDDIASAVDMSPPTIYRFFHSKGAILTALFLRGADRVSGDAVDVLSVAAGPREAVTGLVDAYVQRSIASRELAYVYYAERPNVPAEDRAVIHNIQRATVEAWSSQVAAARPGCTPDEARFAVHAAFALAVDMGRLFDDDPVRARAILRHLMLTVLLG